MSVTEATFDRRAGLLNVVDIVAAPNAAFDRLRVVPTWGWAFLAASLLGVAGSLMSMQASVHAMHTWLPATLAASPGIAKLPADQQARIIATQTSVSSTIVQFTWLFIPIVLLVAAALQALVMTIANAAGRGDGAFVKFFALAVNAEIVGSGLALLVIGVVALLRGADAFDTPSSVQTTLPSLALLSPVATGPLHGFLAGLNVFYVWATVLLALGMQRVGRVPRAHAWTAAAVILLSTAAVSALGARQG